MVGSASRLRSLHRWSHSHAGRRSHHVAHHRWRPHAHHRRHRSMGPHHHRRHAGWHHSLAWRRTSELVRWRNGNADLGRRRCERILCDLSGLECGCGGVDQVLGLLLHPLLVVELDIVAMLSAGAMRFPDTGGVVGQVGIAVVTIVLWHRGARILDIVQISKLKQIRTFIINNNRRPFLSQSRFTFGFVYKLKINKVLTFATSFNGQH